MTDRRSSNSRSGYLTSTVLPGLVLIIMLMIGALVGAWGLPRLVVLVLPHAPRLAIYGSIVLGILLGAVAGIAGADVLVKACQSRPGNGH